MKEKIIWLYKIGKFYVFCEQNNKIITKQNNNKKVGFSSALWVVHGIANTCYLNILAETFHLTVKTFL